MRELDAAHRAELKQHRQKLNAQSEDEKHRLTARCSQVALNLAHAAANPCIMRATALVHTHVHAYLWTHVSWSTRNSRGSSSRGFAMR